MGTADTPTTAPGMTADVPAHLLSALNAPPLGRRGWQTALAPQFIGLFLWVAFFDQIPSETVHLGGILWPTLGAGIAGLFCYLFLYRTPALWGMSTGRPLDVLTTSTFGVQGATYVPGLLLTASQVVWLAVAVFYSTALSLRGLVLLQLLDRKFLLPLASGRFGGQSLLFLVTAFLWCFAVALVGRYLVRVIAALMNVYPILPALMLGVTTVLALKGLRGFHPDGVPPAHSLAGLRPGLWAMGITVQMIFGFFAASGLASADWGTTARNATDVRLGGWVGVVFAPWVVTTLAILCVAGAQGSGGIRPNGPSNFIAALEAVAPERLAGSMLLAFGLTALAPACYASYIFSTRLNELKPKISRTKWTIVVASLAWLLVAYGLVSDLYRLFSVVGGLIAPALGAMAADRVRARGTWPGPRTGRNHAGLVAWLAGSIVGLAPSVVSALDRVQPVAVLAFVVAFVTYLIAAWVGLESPPDNRPALRP